MITVYTVIFNNYDSLRDSIWPSVCLTDKKLAPSKGWSQRLIKPTEGLDSRRASRFPKLLPHKFFNSEYTLYLDGNVRLLTDPEELVKRYLKHTDLALFPHPQRKCIYAEAAKVITRNKEDPELVNRQIDYYRSVKFPEDFGLTACWVILRRNTLEVQRFGEKWWEVYQRFTCRDQLSFDYVRWLTGIKYCRLPGNMFKKTSRHFRRSAHK